MGKKQRLIELFNSALEDEHQAFVQYLSHAELVSGKDSEPIVERLKEIANDEKGHQEKFREMIGMYLGGVPSMKISKTYEAKTLDEILKTNLKNEMEAVDKYMSIMEELSGAKDELKYVYMRLEHNLRHIIMDEQEHIAELKQLLGQ
ncbi:MAG: ferritin-like domain-containing protein [Candidatus Micrarchaeota archaeon]